MSTYFVSPTGSSGNPGTLASPWSLDHARTGAGGTIVAGDTVILSSGTYARTTACTITVGGIAGSPVTFVGAAGGATEISGALTAPTWELYDAPTNTYRTVAATYGSGSVTGHIYLDGAWWPLVAVASLGYLTATSQNIHPTDPYYLGPSIVETPIDGRIYIRLTSPSQAVNNGLPVPQVASTDPAANTIKLSTLQYGLLVNADHVVVKDIECNDVYSAFALQNRTDVDLINPRSTRFGYIAFRAFASTGYTVTDPFFDGRMDSSAWWACWADFKLATFAALPSRKCAISFDTSSFGAIDGGTIARVFDGALADTGAHDLEVAPDTFLNVWDDAFQMGSYLYNINFHPRLCLGAGPSRDGSGSDTKNDHAGSIYVHDFVVDTTTHPIQWGRSGTAAIDSRYTGIHESIPFSTHGGPTGNRWAVPWKMYHVTAIVDDQVFTAMEIGNYGDSSVSNHYSESTAKNAVCNCIFDPGNASTVSSSHVDGSSRELWGGNLYASAQPSYDVTTSAQAAVTLDASYTPTTADGRTGGLDLTATGWPGTTVAKTWRGAIQQFNQYLAVVTD